MPLFANNLSTTLSSPLTDVGEQVVIPLVDADLLPADFAGRYVMLTLASASAIEIVRATGRSGDTLTVVRGQEGTVAQAWPAGAKIEGRLTAGALNAIKTVAITASDARSTVDLPTWKRRSPFGMHIQEVRAALDSPQPSGSAVTIDVLVNGLSILSGPITIENGQTTSKATLTQPSVISPTLPDDTEIEFRVLSSDDAGAGGPSVTLIGEVNPFAAFPPPPPLWEDAYLAWEFEEAMTSEAAADSSPNGRSGTYNEGAGSILLGQTGPSAGGNAAQFSGDAAGVNCAITGVSLPSGNGNGVMMELFLRRDGFPSEDPWPVAFMDDGNGVAGNNYVSVRVNDGLQVLDGVEFDPLEAISTQSSVDQAFELWHVWVQRSTVTPEFDFGSLQIYRQGNLVRDLLLNGDHPPAVFTRFFAGIGEVAGSIFGHPLVAHVALFNFKLSPAQLQERCANFGVPYLG